MNVMTEIVKWTGNEHLTSGHECMYNKRQVQGVAMATDSSQRHLYIKHGLRYKM